jgi:hypothetical protein
MAAEAILRRSDGPNSDLDGASTLPMDSEPLFPGYTTWERTRICFCASGIPTLPNNTEFLGHWEISLGMPLFVYSLILTSYLLAMLCLVPYFDHFWWFFAIFFSVIFAVFSFCYAKVIIDGPGYFPFYWPLPGPQNLSDSEMASLFRGSELSPSGIVSTQEQHLWVKPRKKPNRCIFSTAARRIVIRPDHFCGWTSTWIERRNHKFFILFNAWSCS